MRWNTAGAGLCLLLLNGGVALAQEELPEIELTEVDETITKLWVNGYVNVLLVRCGGSHVLIDSGFEETAAQLQEKLRELDVGRVEYLVNTHSDGDHTGGNAVLGRESTIVSHPNCRRDLAEREGFPTSGLPTRTFTDSLRLPCASGEVRLLAFPGGHTDSDIIVHLPLQGIVYLGDIIVPESFPVVWLRYGERTGVERLVGVLGTILDLFPDDTRFLSAHGRDYAMEDLRTYREMVVHTVDRVRQAMDAGLTVEEMNEKDILGDWGSWNSSRYDWLNTDYWIETVVESLQRGAPS